MVTTGINDDGIRLVPHFPLALLRKLLERQDPVGLPDTERFDSLVRRGIPPIVNPKLFAYMLGVSPKLLYAMAHVPDRYYRRFAIPKRTGGARTISSPRVFLKTVQKWILINILYRRSMPEYVTGFVRGKGILQNAKFHLAKTHLARVDIADFFPSIGPPKVRGVLESFGYNSDVVNLLTRLTTLNAELPQGAPTSPYLANLVFLPCDEAIQKMARERNVVYSRYADDLIFSSDVAFSGDFLRGIEGLIANAGFRINQAKSLKVGKGQRHIVTGFVVNQKVHPPRALRRCLRAKFHQAERDPKAFKKDYHRMQGWAAYVNMYDEKLGQTYLAIAEKIPKPSAGHK
jgi:RNA-directed DNA polymerase